MASRRRGGARAATLETCKRPLIFFVEAREVREKQGRKEDGAAAGQKHRTQEAVSLGVLAEGEAAAGQDHRIQEVKNFSLGVLPEDLMIAVLMRLPLPSLLRMRALSTSFNTFLRSPPFPVCSQPPWLITVKVGNEGPVLGLRQPTPRELIAYCPHLNTWFPLPFEAHPGLLSAMGGPGLMQVPIATYLGQYYYPPALTMASCGGLICTVVTALQPQDFHLLVFNVLTGASKRLPPPPPRPPCTALEPRVGDYLSVYMLPDGSSPGAYYVVLSTPRNNRYEGLSIFSSRTGCWMDGPAASYPGTFGDVGTSDLFCHDHESDHGPYMPRFRTLSAYAVRSNSQLSIPIFPAEETDDSYSVFKWQGRIFLAGMRLSKDFRSVPGFTVRVLTSTSRWSNSASWVEVARTPSSLVQVYPAMTGELNFNFVLFGNLVCMTGLYISRPECNYEYLRPLVYDLGGDLWYYLPPPCIKGTTSDAGVGLLAFQPNLHAMP